MGIVVIGAVFVDIKGYLEGICIPGGRNVGMIEHTHGGVARNVAEDIANVELRPTFVSLVDQSGTGTDVINKLKRHKVNTKYIRLVKHGMDTWLAVFDSNGDVTASISRRPELAPIARVLERRDFLQQIDCFVCNRQEAGMLFYEDYTDKTPQQMVDIQKKQPLRFGAAENMYTQP